MLNTRIILALTKSHCLAAIDYAAEILIGSSPYNLKKLEAAEHRALTNAIGVARTCARNECQILTSFTSLKKRWALKTLKFLAGLAHRSPNIFNEVKKHRGAKYCSKEDSNEAARKIVLKATGNQYNEELSDYNAEFCEKQMTEIERRNTIEDLASKNKRELLRRLASSKNKLYKTNGVRKLEMTISNLILDTLPFEKIESRLRKSQDENCRTCHVKGTSVHGVFECSRSGSLRKRYLGREIISDLGERVKLIEEHPRRLHSFIWETIRRREAAKT
ncbi:hypothetical protein MHBO_003950 [Bonamia ostreae]|uniref:Uncharacterized protein n=1 Tax=Bonamia ostreae TaxID=126728 RepID=A0ABV2ASL4_9EUKA